MIRYNPFAIYSACTGRQHSVPSSKGATKTVSVLLTIGMAESFHSRELAEAFQAASAGQAAVLLHHAAHVGVLLEDLIHFLHSGAAAFGDALAALAVDQVVVGALARRSSN